MKINVCNGETVIKDITKNMLTLIHMTSVAVVTTTIIQRKKNSIRRQEKKIRALPPSKTAPGNRMANNEGTRLSFLRPFFYFLISVFVSMDSHTFIHTSHYIMTGRKLKLC